MYCIISHPSQPIQSPTLFCVIHKIVDLYTLFQIVDGISLSKGVEICSRQQYLLLINNCHISYRQEAVASCVTVRRKGSTACHERVSVYIVRILFGFKHFHRRIENVIYLQIQGCLFVNLIRYKTKKEFFRKTSQSQ